MRRRRNEIGDERRHPAAGLDDHHLMVQRVAAGPDDSHAGHDRRIVVHELQDARLRQRHVIIRQIARARPDVGVRRIVPLAAPDDVLRARKAGPQTPVRVANREAARVIEVQVRGEHDVDVLGRTGPPRRAHGRDAAPAPRRRCRGTSRPLCRPGPASMIIVRAPRTMSGRIASVIRLRSSAAPSSTTATFGTVPNIEPPSRRKKPSHREMSSRSPSENGWIADAPAPGSVDGRLFQLDQHAVRRGRMDEGDERAFGAGARPIVDQPRPRARDGRAPRRCLRRAT